MLLKILYIMFILMLDMIPTPHAWTICDVTKYGARGDGVSKDTKAITKAILACHGGGRVYLPSPGKYLSGPINLTDNIELYIAHNASFLASQDTRDYPIIAPLPSYGWSRDVNCFDPSMIHGGLVVNVSRYSPVIGAFNAKNITVTGGGEINGQGQSWYDICTSHNISAGRPRLLELNHVNGVSISDLILRDSPFWTVHPIYSENIHVKNLQIFAPMNKLGNTDGINPDSSKNVLIEDCFIANSDDGVTLKAGKDSYGLAVGIPTENVFIRNITTPSGFRGGVEIGSEMSGGIRNVTVIDSSFHGERSIHIKSCPGRGGFVEDVTFKNINFSAQLAVTMSYSGEIPGGPVPLVANIHFDNVTSKTSCHFDCSKAAGHACFNMTFTNVHFTRCNPPKVVPIPAFVCSAVDSSKRCIPALPDTPDSYPSLDACEKVCSKLSLL